MDAEELFRRWIEELWAGRTEVAGELVGETFVGHWPDREVHGAGELVELIEQTHAALRPLVFMIEVGPSTGRDLVAGRWRGEGRQDGKVMRFAGNDILRVDGGRFVEYWTASIGLP